MKIEFDQNHDHAPLIDHKQTLIQLKNVYIIKRIFLLNCRL